MLRNCQDCNKVFSHPTMRLCQSCYNKKNEEFLKVKEYIINNRSAFIYEVSTETQVSVETINGFITEGRLKIRPADVVLQCAICQSIIESGRVCNKCSSQLQEDYSKAEPKLEEQTGETGKVHIYDQIRTRRKR